MSEKPYRFLERIEALPAEKRDRDSYYDQIIREFLFSGAKYAEVKDIGKKPLTVQIGLKNRLKKRNEKISTLMINKKVYLERLDLPQNSLQPSSIRKTESGVSQQKVSFDIVKLLNSRIVKARCPQCSRLNAKDTKYCSDCGCMLYLSEEEYKESVLQMQNLEKSLNSMSELPREATEFSQV